MKVPLEWLNEYVDANKPVKEVAKDFTALGLMLDKYDENNNVLDLEHRMDRSDWLSLLGCARDYAAFNRLTLKYPKLHEAQISKIDTSEKVEIKVSGSNFVNRFYTRIIKNITVKESPEWLKARLAAYGMPSINNIVDITNYVMIEYGQPMHAHDISKMEAHEIEFRYAKKGEKITTLLGQEIELDESIYVTSNNGKPTGIAGIVGGRMVAIDKTTKNIVIDSGNYNQDQIRKTSRKIKIMNETVLRTDKFLHPLNNELAIKRATELILELAGGIAYENEDYYPNEHKPVSQTLRYERLIKIGGMDIDKNIIEDILQRLEYKILSRQNDTWVLEIPYFRTDVVVEDDIVADILRINDYANIPSANIDIAPPVEITPIEYKFEQNLKDELTRLGLDEHITAPFVPVDTNNKEQIVLLESMSVERQALRTSIKDTLQAVIETYQKHKCDEIAIFEIGNTYHKVGAGDKYEDYTEQKELEIFYTNAKKSLKENSEYIRQLLASVLLSVGIDDYKLVKANNNTDIYINESLVGNLTYTNITLYLSVLLDFATRPNRVVSEIHNYSSFDISLVVDVNKPFGEIYNFIKKFDKSIVDVNVVEEYIGDKVEEGKKAILVKVTTHASSTGHIRESLLTKLVETFNISHRS